MTPRTFEELKDAVKNATIRQDATSLIECAAELDALATLEAEAVAHMARGVGFALRGDYPAALEHFHRALDLYEELGNTIGVAGVTGNIGNVHRSTGNYPAALEYFQRVMAMYEELGESSGIASVTGNIGLVHSSTGNYPAALEHLQRALSMHEKLGESVSVARVTNGIGNVHDSTGNYPAALEHFHRALAMHEELDDRSGVARVTSNIGNVYLNTGNYPAALEHYQRALALYEELGNRSGVALIVSNIGIVHGRTDNYPAALEHSRRALAMHEELGESGSVAIVTGNVLNTMILLGELAEAEALLQTMDAMQIHDPGVVICREHHRASLQEHHGNIDEARATIRAALLIAQEHTLAPEQAGVHKALRDLALKQNDLAGYVEHNNEYSRITEEINGKESTLKMAMQEKQREIDAREKEHQKHMAVLHSTLPKHVAERVARGEVVNDQFDNASVIFLDIVGFTELSSSMSSHDVIALLDTIFTQCDAICEQHNVIKIKTIGDSYMCVSFGSVINAARAALEMMKIESRINNQESNQGILQYRIGVHCGPLTAGVIGTQRMQYDVWGDTVNVASRMESSGEAGRVHVSQAFAENLEEESRIKNQESHEVSHASVARPSVAQSELVTRHSSLVTIDRGSIDVKGKGLMKTFWLEGS